MALEERLAVARGERPADLVIRGADVVCTFTGEILRRCDVAVADGVVVGLGPGYEGKAEADASGGVLAPGLVDGHIHIESTFLSPREFARVVVPHGTSAVYWDPHEIANVLGAAGVRSMLAAAQGLPLDLRVMVPSCVPATDMETAGASLGPDDVKALLAEPGVHGLAEVMNYPGVILGVPAVLAKVRAADEARLPADGHAPGVLGRSLNAYLVAGIRADHESTQGEEAAEKLRKGMYVNCREATGARNFDELLPRLTAANARRWLLCTDDRHPDELVQFGHVDYLVREAVKRGVPAVTAITMATLNVAECYGARREGAVAPGFRADLVLFDDLQSLQVVRVYKDGRLVASDGELVADLPEAPDYPALARTVKLPAAIDLRIPARPGKVRVIEVVPGQIVTRAIETDPPVRHGEIASDPDRDLLKLVVVERHGKTGGVGKALVRGLGLKAGALASTVAHDSHNVIACGVTDADITKAIRTVAEGGGGQAVVRDGRVLARLVLPIAGLMSMERAEEVARTTAAVVEAARGLGSPLLDPFMALSFLALPVIPSLKLTDKGLVDVERFKPVSLYVE